MNRVASIFCLLIAYASSHRVLLHKQRPAATERRMSQGRLPVNGHATEFGNDYYFATVMIGEPAQPAHLIVDTGSSVTYVPCTTTCKHCGHHDSGYFQPQKSSTFASLDCTHDLCTPASGVRCESNQCAYTVRYLEGSGHTGFLVSDNLQLPGNVSQRIVFGCTESEQGQLYTQAADGVMGLGQGPLSIPNQLADENSRDVFALCLAAGGETGVLSLGQQDWPSTVQWTPMLSIHNAWYGLVLNTINIGTMSFTVSSNTVLDSGCTDLLLPNPLFDAISSGIIKHVASKYTSFQHNDGNWCFRGDSGVLRALPDITLALADLPLTLPPSKYVFNAATASQQSTRSTRDWCLAIFPNSNDLVLIGSNAVLDKWVVYDRENHRIGLGDAVGGCASDGSARTPDNIFTYMARYPAAAWLAVAIISFLLGVGTMCIVHITRHRRASREFSRISASDGEEVELEEIATVVEAESSGLEEADSIAV